MLNDDVRVFLHMIYQKDAMLKLHYLLLQWGWVPGTLNPGRSEAERFHLH